MVARVTLEIALRKEFDYAIPADLTDRVEVGSRVKVPFGSRSVLGVVTAIAESSPHTNLKSIVNVIGAQSLVTHKVLALAQWIAEYYCCPVEIALKSVLPDAVRKEDPAWRERLHVYALPAPPEVPKLTKRQETIWKIVEEWRDIPLQELLRLGETTAETVRRLEEKSLVKIASKIDERDPYANEQVVPTEPHRLNEDQAKALRTIIAAMERNRCAASGQTNENSDSATFLLYGVTGSGKTEVYLQAIAYALERGLGAIVLVPEISLTPQTVDRFKARFSSGPLKTGVAVLHSHLSSGERHDEWHKIRQGRAKIAIGARSAIFAPVEPLGLIIVDEEHEPSYKQQETPRYHARDVAVVRGQREGAVVVLGSATPSLESYYNATRKKYALLELPKRAYDQKMPVVRVIDLRDESRKTQGNAPPIFSRPLREAILQRLERGEQTMLFLNRRGFSTSLQCVKCGYVAGCPNCSVSLTFHRAANKLLCHICGHEETVPTKCPTAGCANPAIKYGGLGTEKVEDVLRKLFAKARIQRMDSDTLKSKNDYRIILGDFRTGKIDILLGTQMIAKGLDFPNVTLVGIVYADLSLHVPDFRAGERTFQLLTQVSGRAGRGDVEGEVFVQTFTPFHPAIQFARRHDFQGFYDQEIEHREPLKYPPIYRIALLTIKGRSEDKVRFSADYIRKELDRRLVSQPDVGISGPAPAPLLKAEAFYRHQLMLRTRRMGRLSPELNKLTAEVVLPEDVSLSVDVDPLDLM